MGAEKLLVPVLEAIGIRISEEVGCGAVTGKDTRICSGKELEQVGHEVAVIVVRAIAIERSEVRLFPPIGHAVEVGIGNLAFNEWMRIGRDGVDVADHLGAVGRCGIAVDKGTGVLPEAPPVGCGYTEVLDMPGGTSRAGAVVEAIINAAGTGGGANHRSVNVLDRQCRLGDPNFVDETIETVTYTDIDRPRAVGERSGQHTLRMDQRTVDVQLQVPGHGIVGRGQMRPCQEVDRIVYTNDQVRRQPDFIAARIRMEHDVRTLVRIDTELVVGVTRETGCSTDCAAEERTAGGTRIDPGS